MVPAVTGHGPVRSRQHSQDLAAFNVRSKSKRAAPTSDIFPPAGSRVWTTGLAAQPSRATMLLRHLEAMLAKGEAPNAAVAKEDPRVSTLPRAPEAGTRTPPEIEDAATSLLPTLLGTIEEHQTASLRDAIAYLTSLIEDAEDSEPVLESDDGDADDLKANDPQPAAIGAREDKSPTAEPTAEPTEEKKSDANVRNVVELLGPEAAVRDSTIRDLPEIKGPRPTFARDKSAVANETPPVGDHPGSAAIWALLQSLSATGSPMPRLESLHAVMLAYAEAAKLFK